MALCLPVTTTKLAVLQHPMPIMPTHSVHVMHVLEPAFVWKTVASWKGQLSRLMAKRAFHLPSARVQDILWMRSELQA